MNAARADRLALAILNGRLAGVGLFLALLAVGFGTAAPNFASVSNANTIALNGAILIVVACAVAIVVITRNYDLSVGSVVALSAYVGLDATRLLPGAGPILALLPLAIGAACGAVNGALVAGLRLPSVVATLGTMSIFRGLAYLYAGGRQVDPRDLPPWVAASVAGHVLGVSVLVLLGVAIAGGAALALHYLRIGRAIYAIGSNPDAAPFYGISRPRITFKAYVACGALTGLAGFLFGARVSYVVPYLAQGLELTALAAVVLGGISVLGGSGNVFGAALGALTIATIENGLVLLGAPEFMRQFAYGAIIVLAVMTDAALQRRVMAALRARRARIA